MQWRSLCLVRAVSAAGLLSGAILGAAGSGRADEPAAPAGVAAEAVKILDARKAGDLEVAARGQGDGRVKLALRNTSGRRLNVVLPPGLVAANATGQGFQSMGLGAPTAHAGAFGAFRATGPEAGFRSVGVSAPADGAIDVPAGQTVELTVPAVCLNFGLPTPTPKDSFELVDVDDFTPDARVRKALRSLAETGTSLGTAQAAMWRVCNGVPFEAMLARGGKMINAQEVALAARFVEALDTSGSSESVDPAYLSEGRVFVAVSGEGTLASEAARVAEGLEGARLFGMPARVVAADEAPTVVGPALHLSVSLAGAAEGKTQARVVVRSAGLDGRWSVLGNTTFAMNTAPEVVDADGLALGAERAVSGAFVKVKPIRKAAGETVVRVENRLPFTLAHVWVKAGDSAGAPTEELAGMGVGPARAGVAPIRASSAKVERVELNGL